MNNLKLILADVETASLKRPEKPATGIVQVAWLVLQENASGFLDIAEEHCSLIDPGCPIDAKASEIHGLYDHDVVGQAALFDFFKVEEPCFFIAHNRAFDYPRLAEGMANCVDSLCTLMASRRILKDAPNHKLVTLVEHYGLEMGKAHDALGDCRMTHQLINLLIEKSDMSLQELAKFVNTPKVPEKMPFGTHQGKSFADLSTSYITYMLGMQDLDPGLRTALEMQRRSRGNGI